MKRDGARFSRRWAQLGIALLPFADAATKDLPLSQILRLSLFQISVGMAAVLLTGTLNRVMIADMGMPAVLVAVMVALPLVFAPLRALIGFKSDTHVSALGWRRVPFIWFGSLMQFGGLAIMPFALILLSGDSNAPAWVGFAASALAFLLVGAGMHTTQTAGLALATDLATEENRPRVVALLYVMLLVGMVLSAIVIGLLLVDFSELKLIRVVQGAAALTIILNIAALWRQEARAPELTRAGRDRPSFAQAWAVFAASGRHMRLLVAVGLGAAAFSMQDVLLEPYGAEVLGLSVAGTTVLTALWAAGALAGFGLAARGLGAGFDPHRLAAYGMVVGVFAFAFVILSDPLGSPILFQAGAVLIGLGGGLFAVGTLTAVMELGKGSGSGMALGAWGAVQATAAGAAIAIGGGVRDLVEAFAQAGHLGPAMTGPSVGYSVVYHIEIALLFAALAAIGPLARHAGGLAQRKPGKFGLAEFPG
ncbi:BCD family MFS transporter [Alkalicaulis satelles]|uniref:BCD family MFS transporter n=1 Tax=Alkalicaulis satelles TaxID=2609175 RepID=A0A5M6ZGX6_9PROT|nr:BCD family MFS transporter [Alkalicaulis satelles]KAA5804026.1 BCD family MFS transporter [Alkalicaulis satelles]